MASPCTTLLVLLSLIVLAVAKPPKRCKELECPTYHLIEQGKGFEIRRYNPSIWVSTAPIKGKSFVFASATGHSHLFKYTNGPANDQKKERKKKLNMTAPPITTVTKDTTRGSAALFYVPKEYQSDPPKAEGLEVKKVESTYMAVRQFGGYAIDTTVIEEVRTLRARLNGTKWDDAIKKKKRPEDYAVAQYNALVEFWAQRLNEIRIPFSWKN